ncbi:hypothetical protein ACET3X_007814 [Alternaria dauci]|uniref:non-specific serine/threonine protein kinase n=1 Tax=Alternaria dauci TaxID=48095 RepID=A0ABR3UD43_9PLEO
MPHKSVFLCVRTNDAGVIEDQITVKCLEALNKRDIDNAEHEIGMNNRISTLNCSHMISHRGSSKRQLSRTINGRSSDEGTVPVVYNIYSTFAELGTLARIYKGHELTRKKPVPEHFIWYLLSQVAKALTALQKGTCSSPNREDQIHGDKLPTETGEDENLDPTSMAWKGIIHSDIKNANIFLQRNNADYPAYPRVVLSDFDIALEKDNNYDMDRRKYQGTPGLMPPERDGAGVSEDSWAPDDWPVSEKSDVWSLAMTVWALMMAHTGMNVYEEVQELSEDPKHVRRLKENKIKSKDSIFPQMLEDLPKEYSVRLCQVLSRCLRYNPKERMSLEILQKASEDNLSRLDRMYGDEIRKQEDAIADEFKLAYTTEDSEEWAQYAIGQKFVPPRKRRKADNTDASEQRLTSLVTDWASETGYPRPSAMVQDDVLELVDNLISSSMEEAIQRFRERKGYLTSWQHLCSSIRKRVPSQRGVYVATNVTDEALRASLQRDSKRAVLILFRDTVLGSALVTASEDEKSGFGTLQHAVMWGLVLLEINAEPVTPRLSDKTEMHRGMVSFILDQPSGVPIHEDADSDKD